MTTRYSVHRGPGNQLVAVSKEPVGDRWTIKSGEQGKKLRVTTVPVGPNRTFRSVLSDYVSGDYQWVCEGYIDAYGENVDADASSISWEARNVDSVEARTLLQQYFAELETLGLDAKVTDSMSGTWLTVDRTTFGISRAPRPGCIHYENGYGAGTLFPASAADLLCLVALLSRSIDIHFADAKGNPLTRGKVISNCASCVSEPVAELLKRHGVQSPLINLRVTTIRSLGF